MVKRLTILVPAFNEAAKLPTTVGEIVAEAGRTLDAYEVIIINDGSRDGTREVAEELARKHAAVRVVHQPVNRGVGAAYHLGLGLARYEHLTLIPGDNAFHHSGVRAVFAAVGQAELVISYRTNVEARTPLRRVLSRTYNRAMRLLTGCPIRDAHGMYVFPVSEARRVPGTDGYGYHMMALTGLLQRVGSYAEVPVLLNPRPDHSSNVMKVRTLIRLASTLGRLYLRRCTVGLLYPPRRPVLRDVMPAAAERAA